MTIHRRALLRSAAALGGAAALPPVVRAAGRPTLPAWYADIERRTFLFFWETVNRRNGLVPDRWPSASFCSIASVGFALTAYPIGVSRGWCTRQAARELTLTTLRFFSAAPQGPAPSGTAGHAGFFYHFLDMETGLRFGNVELSSVDTTILLMGMLFAAEFFDGADADEAEIRRLAQSIYARADWNFFRGDGRAGVSMGWHPDTGLIARNWDGYNEGKFVYILGLGAPDHPLPPGSWDVWTAPYARFWRGEGQTRRLAFAPLFGSQYSETWIDFRGIQDAPMRAAGLDYFENARRETYADRAYCITNPMRWEGYGRDCWGLTACDGPGGGTRSYKGAQREFRGYAARGPADEPDGFDDGTIAPTAALGSIAFAPELAVPAAAAMLRDHRAGLYGRYGFKDSFNPSFRYTDVHSPDGIVDPARGWYAHDYLGIDQGPILAMAANYRDDLVWRYMRRCEPIRRGLARAGFTGGWLAR